MIKINLATRKSPAAVGEGRPKSGLSFDSSALKDLPIRQLAIPIVAILGANIYVDSSKTSALAELDAQISKLTQEQSALQEQRAKNQKYEDTRKILVADEELIRKKIETLQTVMADAEKPTEILKGLSQSTPAELWVSNLMVGPVEVKLNGWARQFSLVADLNTNLNNSGVFSDLKIGESKQEKTQQGVSVVTFEINGKRK